MRNTIKCDVDYCGVHCSAVQQDTNPPCFYFNAFGRDHIFPAFVQKSMTIEEQVRNAIDQYIYMVNIPDMLLAKLDERDKTIPLPIIEVGSKYVYSHRLMHAGVDLQSMDGQVCSVVSQLASDAKRGGKYVVVFDNAPSSVFRVYGCELLDRQLTNNDSEKVANDARRLDVYEKAFGKVYFPELAEDALHLMYRDIRDFMYSDNGGKSWNQCSGDTIVPVKGRVFKKRPAGVIIGANDMVKSRSQDYEYSFSDGYDWHKLSAGDNWIYHTGGKQAWFRRDISTLGWSKTNSGTYCKTTHGSSVEMYKAIPQADGTYSVVHAIINGCDYDEETFKEDSPKGLMVKYADRYHYYVYNGESGIIYRWEDKESAETYILATIMMLSL